MYLYFDRTGYPMIPLKNRGYLMHLFPVTRKQFAQCDTLQESFKSACDAVHKAAPHVKDKDLLENQLMTGILPSEVETFCNWLSEDQEHNFQIPATHEWPDLFSVLIGESIDKMTLLDQCESTEVQTLIQNIMKVRSPATYQELSLKNSGIVEWVKKGMLWRGRGQPRFEFSRTAFGNPDRREIIPIDGYRHKRSFLFGFRLIQPY